MAVTVTLGADRLIIAGWWQTLSMEPPESTWRRCWGRWCAWAADEVVLSTTDFMPLKQLPQRWPCSALVAYMVDIAAGVSRHHGNA